MKHTAERNSSKRYPGGIIRILLTGVLLVTTVHAGAQSPDGEVRQVATGKNGENFKLIVNAYICNIASEQIGKNYLYIGNKIGTRAAGAEMQKAFGVYTKNFTHLAESVNDPDTKNLIGFIQMSYESLLEAVKQPYTLDNAQSVLDYTTMVSEGLRHIANRYKKIIGGHSFLIKQSGVNPLFESIAKYYMAYQAGIKDENTVTIMKETVDQAGRFIEARVKYAGNTPEMNQIMHKVKRLWEVVRRFYLKIDDGGLPFIVYKTASDLQKSVYTYNKMLFNRGIDKTNRIQ